MTPNYYLMAPNEFCMPDENYIHGPLFQKKHLTYFDIFRLPPNSGQNTAQGQSSNKTNNETEETFSPSSGTSADSSSSVTVAMENLSTDPDLASGAMEVDEKDKDAKRPDSNLHHQIKQIKPLLGKFTKI